MRNNVIAIFVLIGLICTACSKDNNQVKTDLVSEPTIEVADGDHMEIKGFTLAHELCDVKGFLPPEVGIKYGYLDSYKYKVYIVRTEYVYHVRDNYAISWPDTENAETGFYPNCNTENGYQLENVDFDKSSFCISGRSSVDEEVLWIDTVLIHIIRVVNGEDVDVWIPRKPFDLKYQCYLLWEDSE